MPNEDVPDEAVGPDDDAPEEDAWPDDDAVYEYPEADDAQRRWQDHITAGLDDGSLKLTKRAGGRYDLGGACPRCGHPLSQVIYFGILAPGAGDFYVGDVPVHAPPPPPPDMASKVTVEVVCSCRKPHPERDEKKRGCGWGRGLPVTIERPR